jgi:hypothetical protein
LTIVHLLPDASVITAVDPALTTVSSADGVTVVGGGVGVDGGLEGDAAASAAMLAATC